MKKLLLLLLLLLLSCSGNKEVPQAPVSCNGSIAFVGSCWGFDPVSSCNNTLFLDYRCVACRNDLDGVWHYFECQR